MSFEKQSDGSSSGHQPSSAPNYRALVEQLPAITYTVELGQVNRTVFISPQVESLLGFSPQEWLADRELWIKLIHPEDRERVLAEVRQRDARQTPLDIEYRARSRDGRLIWFHNHNAFVPGEEGRPGYLHGVMRDITRRRVAEESLHRRNQFLATLHQITLDLLDRRNIDDILQAIVERAAELLDAPFAEIALAAGDDLLVVRAFTRNQPFLVGDQIRRGEGRLTWQAFDTRQPAVMDDYANWPERRALYDGVQLRAAAEIPISVGDKCLGILGLARNKPGHVFDSEQINVAVLFAQLAALVLDNAQLYADSQRELAEHKRMVDALRQSESRFATTFHASPVATAIMTLAEGRFIDVNQSFERLSRRSFIELIGYTPEELKLWVAFDDQAKVIKTLLQGKPVRDLEIQFRSNPGETRHAIIHLEPIELDGQSCILALAEDITERIKAQAALEAERDLLVALMNNVPDTIYFKDTDSRFTRVNPAQAGFLGLSDPVQAVGKTDADFQSRALATKFLAEEQAIIRSGQPIVGRVEFNPTSDGQPRWLSATKAPIKNQRGQVVGLVGISRDITQIILARQNHESLINSIDGIVWEADARTLAFSFVSQQAARMLGYPIQRWLDEPAFWQEHIHPEDREWAVNYCLAAAAEGRNHEFEYRMLAADGRVVWLRDIVTVIAEAGQPEKLRGIMMDITTRKQHEQEREAVVSLVTALRITHSQNEMFPIVLRHVMETLQAEGAALGLIRPETGEVVIELGAGLWANITGLRLQAGEGITGHVLATGQSYLTNNVREDPLYVQKFQPNGVNAIACIPLIAQGQTIGVLWLGRGAARGPAIYPDITADDVKLLTAIGEITASAIHRAALLAELQASNTKLTIAYDETIEGWSRALDLRDKETEGHSRRVTEMTLRLARVMEIFSETDLSHIRWGALLHDIGKMGIPDRILHKPGPLVESEWAVVRQHPEYARDLLTSIDFLHPALDIPLYHHEKWDGAGYPFGLSGEQIPLAARIFAVVDVWDALLSDRPYRPGWSKAEVLAHIREQSGKHFDPQVAEAFIKLVASE